MGPNICCSQWQPSFPYLLPLHPKPSIFSAEIVAVFLFIANFGILTCSPSPFAFLTTSVFLDFNSRRLPN
ncbi:hypothetical protein Peur_025110 [Populus x canadensis]